MKKAQMKRRYRDTQKESGVGGGKNAKKKKETKKKK
jgi:hypothetical protein